MFPCLVPSLLLSDGSVDQSFILFLVSFLFFFFFSYDLKLDVAPKREYSNHTAFFLKISLSEYLLFS